MISIIVPIYKTEKYLHRCIKSIISQTYKDWELLLVNDGSPDKSVYICEEYIKIDSRVKLLNKQNGGLSSARNFGFNYAKGDWVTFVDSDDYISPFYLENLFKSTLEYNSDLVITGAIEIISNHKNVRANETHYVSKENFGSFFLNSESMLNVVVWGKLYKKSVLDMMKSTHRLFDENCKYHEDEVFFFDIMPFINSIVTTNTSDYFYIRRSDSITGSFKINFSTTLYISKQINNSFERYSKTYNEELNNYLKRKLVNWLYLQINTLLKLEDKKEILKGLRLIDLRAIRYVKFRNWKERINILILKLKYPKLYLFFYKHFII